ncbi:dihydrofolate reductase [Spiroplasma tabanidicola]|uniref:dihydrofolate reductase n=1 Tax=Spiroplasma tabanidicola TaxID=324079 RepID=A0A6I6C939_9MOLU|nr:dihydrofolate reductase [Spiroplasma tabanidicola]QGS52126.1 dihydrofolate reductase [Spiroplasma tabanidicola]
MVTLIWAQSKNNAIGLNGHLPWDIKEEMQHFVNYTRGKTVLMGRNTWNSLKLKPLPKRKNIVVTTKGIDFIHENLEIVDNLEKVIKDFKNSDEELIIIGGKQIFDYTINFADRLVVSYIFDDYKGDLFASEIDKKKFKVIGTKDFSEFQVKIYERAL